MPDCMIHSQALILILIELIILFYFHMNITNGFVE